MAVLQKKSLDLTNVSVVIPTYQRPRLALQAAASIRKFHKDIEIIIVDQQNSAKPDLDEVKKLRVKFITIETVNTSRAKNHGIAQSKGDFVFFFDDDVEISQDTIPAQLTSYENPSVVATAGRVINDGEHIPKETDVITGRTNRLATKFIFQYWSTRQQYVDFPYGCNMSFRKKNLLLAGGFDEHFPKIFEEIDLGVRISSIYGKILFVPEAVAYHHKAISGGTRTDKKGKNLMIYSHYGYYLAKHVQFPLSLVSLILRTKSALFEAPYALPILYQSYAKYFLSK